MEKISLMHIETLLGVMVACATQQGLCMLEFTDRKKIDWQIVSLKTILQNNNIVEDETPILTALKCEMAEYFAGKRQQFSVPLHFAGTNFQKKVWTALLQIPFGETTSYMQLAETIGDGAKYVRAVANANAANKIAIVVPCHRVIGSDGSLTGYAGGLHRKNWLLNHEDSKQKLFL
ncbi:MAG: methylated-DNA--[protein]-cysteine S-methyltransferase [Cytophagaceae bacterium]|jgi:AraC family transcriptional regulator of adaptative response/methylated-DNA-[protein]-cysteine methyltransferase|nr:methylated-DNA--[protein]-cysteine S-methyltransferase [Cytophagaceae bacterium]